MRDLPRRLCLGVLLLSAAHLSAAPDFAIAPAPAWVKKFEPIRQAEGVPASGGVAHLLVDRQENLATGAFFYHEAWQVVTEAGVQTGASVSASFDPSYQKLTFHFIRVWRGDRASDQLQRAGMRLLQREPEMEKSFYDGEFTAQRELENVRVGDVVEFAYTVEGANPVMQGKYSAVYRTQFTFPAKRVVTRLLYPAQRKLAFKITNRALQPVSRREGALLDWLSDDADVPARTVAEDAPDDWEPRGRLQVSEFASWQEVVDWALPLFARRAPLSPELQEEVARLQAIADPAQRVLSALRFAQDEIRYVGMEFGVGSHQPAAPDETLRRRFGDCKDKTLLLCTLLGAAGIDAAPALVSTDFRATVAERLPAPGAFDHAIVQVRLGAAVHWLDATRSAQRGPLAQLYIPEFGQALVLRAGERGLTACGPPPGSLPRKSVVESFRVPAPEGIGELEVTTRFNGLAADRMRAAWQREGREELQKDYLQYYAHRYARIEVRQPVSFAEIPDENGCLVTEFYRIPGIWELNEKSGKYELGLFPGEVSQAMGSAVSAQREDPLALNYPTDVRQEIRAAMFEDWSLQNSGPRTTVTPFYRYSEDAQANGQHIRLLYSYQSLADRVPLAEVPRYNTELSRLKDSLGYNLTYKAPAAGARERGSFNWSVAAACAPLFILATLLGSVFCWISKRRTPRPLPETPSVGALEGLGGWLILVALHQLLRPIGFSSTLVQVGKSVFDLSIWRVLTEPGSSAYHPLWAPALLFELFFNSLGLLACIFLLFLFFKKRAVWPWAYAVFLTVCVAGGALDLALSAQIPATAAGWRESISALVQVVIAAAIWIPYCFLSKRVRATFRY